MVDEFHAFSSLYPAALIFRNTIGSSNMTIKYSKDDKESPCETFHPVFFSPKTVFLFHHAVANKGVILLTALHPRYKHWHLLDLAIGGKVDQNDILN